jgi:hypothetical protein
VQRIDPATPLRAAFFISACRHVLRYVLNHQAVTQYPLFCFDHPFPGVSMFRKSLIAFFAGAALLTGCLVPEKFTAKADIHPDGSYAVSYAGTAVHGLAAMQIAKTGKLSPKDNAALEGEVAKMKRNPDVQSASYKGNGRYELALAAKREKGKALDLLNILSVKTDKDGIITISSPKIDEKSKKELSQLGIKVDGTLAVTIPRDAEVIEHNATATPSFFGLVGTYSWKIGSVDQRPVMKIRLKG